MDARGDGYGSTAFCGVFHVMRIPGPILHVRWGRLDGEAICPRETDPFYSRPRRPCIFYTDFQSGKRRGLAIKGVSR